MTARGSFSASLDEGDWQSVRTDLDQYGYAVLPRLLDQSQCGEMIALYRQDELFRKTIIMQNHAYGQGEYRYFTSPLPPMVDNLRRAAYPHLAVVANQWAEQLHLMDRYPQELEQFAQRCWAAGQKRPTPLLLKYGANDFNRLHQDSYGEISFPLQMAVLLSAPEQDFDGGEFLLSEQRARVQSKAEVVPLGQGDGVIFASNIRPGRSKDGKSGTPRYHRLTHRHGVSRVRSGQRYCLGIIFHDAA
ncbi:MAG: 2OG-Fe(II) oxygenase [Pseudomonadota bacterium]